MFVEEGYIEIDYTPQKLRAVVWQAARELLFELRAKSFHVTDRNCVDNRLLVREETIEPTYRQVRFPRDSVRGDLFQRHSGQQCRAGLQDPMDRFVAPVLQGRSTHELT